MVMDAFWQQVEHALDRIEQTKPDTFDAVKLILDEDGDPDGVSTPGPGKAFFAGSGGNRQLVDSITDAGWRLLYITADYYWVARHPRTKELLTYVEGDLYRGDVAVREGGES